MYNQTIMTKRWMLISVLILVFPLAAYDLPANTSAPTSTLTTTVNPTNTPTPTSTSIPTTTFTPTPTLPPTETAVPTGTDIPCFSLLEPADGTEFEKPIGQITFAWTEQFGAASYRFAITLPNGNVETIETTETSFGRWLESYPLGGEYSWMVEALDSNGVTICAAGLFTFTKGEYMEQNQPGEPENDNNNSNNGSDDPKPTIVGET